MIHQIDLCPYTYTAQLYLQSNPKYSAKSKDAYTTLFFRINR